MIYKYMYTGYGGGIKDKVELLKLEGIDMSKYFVPKKDLLESFLVSTFQINRYHQSFAYPILHHDT